MKPTNKPNQSEQNRRKTGGNITTHLSDVEFNRLSWRKVNNLKVLEGQNISSAEKINPDGVLLGLEDSFGNVSLLKIEYDCLTEKFGVFVTNLEGGRT